MPCAFDTVCVFEYYRCKVDVLVKYSKYFMVILCHSPEFLQRNAVPQPAARVTGTKQLNPKPSKVKVSVSVGTTHTFTFT